jgi:hypothetical protein
MVSATHRLDTAKQLEPLAATSTTASNKTSSFANQLATALHGESQPKMPTRELVGQVSDERQFLGKVKSEIANGVTPISSGPNSTSTSSSASTSTSTTTVGGTPISQIPSMLGMGPAPDGSTIKATTGTQIPVTTTAPEESEADAYWNAQPAAVQVLRNMPDGAAKDQLALQLANAGYSIDTQIMVWGWDPQMTMQVRANQGYSWVPSYGQANIPVGPGLSMPNGSTTYSPSSPPPGSIQVSTAFAVGTVQNPLVQSNTSST